jgi:hypothetical protein
MRQRAKQCCLDHRVKMPTDLLRSPRACGQFERGHSSTCSAGCKRNATVSCTQKHEILIPFATSRNWGYSSISVGYWSRKRANGCVFLHLVQSKFAVQTIFPELKQSKQTLDALEVSKNTCRIEQYLRFESFENTRCGFSAMMVRADSTFPWKAALERQKLGLILEINCAIMETHGLFCSGKSKTYGP